MVSRWSLEDPRAVEEIAGLCAGTDACRATSEVRLLMPMSGSLLDRWSGERRPALMTAQRRCVLSPTALAKAGLTAQADVSDEDVVQAVEDELRTYPATDVILVSGDEERADVEELAAELRARLQTDFLHLEPAPAGTFAGEPRESGHRFAS